MEHISSLFTFIKLVSISGEKQLLYATKHQKLVALLLLLALLPCGSASYAQLSGKVFREFNMNGTADAAVTNSFHDVANTNPTTITTRLAEAGLPGATITVYGDNELILGTTTSTSSGSWSLVIPNSYTGSQVLVECQAPANLSFLQPGPHGTDNSTTVVKVAKNATNVNFTFGLGSEHAQNSPDLALACFALPGPSNATGNPGSSEPMVIRFPYINGGPLTNGTRNATTGTGQNYYSTTKYPPVTSKTVLTTFGQTGTVYGVAYDKRRNRLLTSAFERAYTGIGPNGTGGEGKLYVTTLSTSGTAVATSLWLDLETALSAGVAGTDPAITPGLTFVSATPTTISRFEHNKIGHISLGDLEFSADGKTVFVVNLFSKQIYGIPVNADGSPNAGAIRTYTPTNPCASGSFSDPATPAGVRPYNAVLGLGVHPETGRIYCAVTCSGPTASDLKGYIYSFDPTAATPTFTEELQIPLNFSFQTGNDGTEGLYATTANDTWTPTANDLDVTNTYADHAWMGDIVFDIEPSGTIYMIVGGRNRFMDATSGSRITHGQGLWLSAPTGNSWTLENNGIAGSRTTANVLTEAWFTARNGNGVFFNTHGSEGTNGTGNIIAIPGFAELALGAVDNVKSGGNSGIMFLNRSNGTRTRDILLLGSLTAGNTPPRGEVYKANLWGEAEALLEPAPLEIGNYVFVDLNKNGLQDPSDLPLAGVTVKLVEDTDGDGLPNETAVASTTTNASGQYFFDQTDGLKYDTKYVVILNQATDFTTGALGGMLATTANIGADTKDTRDSDGELLAGGNQYVKVAFETGGPGENRHNYDFGFIQTDCTPPVLTASASQTLCGTGSFSFPLSASVTSSTATTQQWYLTDAAHASFTSISGATSLTLTPTASMTPTVGQTRYFALIGQNAFSFCADTAYVSLTLKPIQTIAFTAPSAATVTQCANTTMNLSVTTNAKAPDQIRFVYFTSPLTTATDAYTATDGTVLGTVTSGTLATNTVSLNNALLPDNTDGTAQTLYVYALLQSADGLCLPTDQFTLVLHPRPTTTIDGDNEICRGTTTVLTASGQAGTTFQWYLNNGTTAVSTANPFTTPAISTTATYRVKATYNGCVSDEAEILLTPVTCTPCVSGTGAIGGNVFRDFNSTGVKDANDPGIGNITVTIFSCNPSGGSVQVAQMQTDIKGQYSFTGLTGTTTYRVEFSGFPAGYEPTYQGTNNGTTVQFTKPGSCSISLGLNQPNDYCQANPQMVTTCFVNGASANTTAPTDILVKFPFTNAGSTPTPSHLANKNEFGSVWGVGYNRQTRQLFTSAFLKRHAGVKDADGNGTVDLGVIYVTSNPTALTSTNTVWADLSKAPYNLDLGSMGTDASRGLGLPSAPNNDPTAFPLVGKVGLGDIDVSEDGSAVWVVTPKTNQVHKIAINADGTAGAMQSFTIPTPCTDSYPRLYIKAGGSVTGKLVDDFVGDEYYAGGTALANTGRTGAAYSSARTGTSFSYLVPLATGTYNVTLSFGNNATVRSETVTVGGTTQTISLSANATQVVSFSTIAVSDLLTIQVGSLNATAALLSGIQITSATGVPFIDRSWPFAVAYKNGNVYVGTTCAAELSQDKDQLQSTVYQLPDNGSTTFTPVLTVPLNYIHGYPHAATPVNRWQAWTGAMDKGTNPAFTGSGSGSGFTHIYPQPLLSDIDFLDNGDMIVGFFDRFGHQTGDYNYTTAGTSTIRTTVAGDVLRANFDGSSYTLEQNGRVSGQASSGGVGNNQGPGGGEFYMADNYAGTAHQETSYGGLAVVPGTNILAVTVLDPIVAVSSGVVYFSNTNGTAVRTYQVTPPQTDVRLFSKANALGDLQAICDLAPIQIGNRVWRDDNQNGIQDPCEPAIPGAVVTLYDATKTTAYASVTTNAAGEYYFASTTLTVGTSTSSVATTALTYTSNYALVITSLGSSTVVTSQGLSLTDVSPLTPGESGTANSGQTAINNDAMVMNGKPTILLTTGGPGDVNHTYDFGIVKPTCSLTVTTQASSQTICAGQPVTLTAQVSPASNYTYVWSAPVGVTLTGANTASATVAASVAGLHTFTVTVISSPTCFTSTTVSVSAVDCATHLAIAITDPGTCLSATNGYTTAGILSLTNAIAGIATITDGLISTTVSVGAGATSLSYSLSGLVSGTGSHTVIVSYAGQTASTTYTAPASCSVAPCGLALIVTPGLCQSATNTYVLSGSISATNLPTSGTLTLTSDAFATRTIALPAGNASGPISYSGLVANGQTYAITATYANSACPPISQTFSAPVSCSVAPVCSLIATATAGLCASATNTYSASIVVSLTNATAGSITISLPGTTPVSQILVANTPTLTVIVPNLPSDGTTHTATISLPGCGTTSASFTAPTSCSVAPVCAISAVATPGLCQSATNTFTNTVVVSLTNPPTGILTVTDGPASLTFASVAASSGSFTATFAGISSTGTSHTVTASLPGCSTISTTYTAPVSCSIAPICSLSATVTVGLCATATNTYSATAVIQLINPTAGVLTVTAGAQSATFVTTTAPSATFRVVFPGLLSDGATHTLTASLPGCSSTTTTYTAPVSCSVAPVCSISAVVTSGLCSTATNTYSATAVVTITNPANGESLTVSTGGQTLVFSTTALSQNTFTVRFNGLVSDGMTHSVLVSLPGCGTANTTYTAPASCSIAPVCSLSAVATPGICTTATNTFSSTVLVTMTNPTAGTLTVTDGARSVTFVVAASLGTTTAPAIFNGIPSDGASHTVTISLPGCSSATLTYTAPVSCTLAPLASLGDYVWYDTNGNGQQDSSETGVSGVTVKLFNPVLSTTTPIASLTTDSNGKYLFTNLNPGVYCVLFDKTTLPTGYTLTSANLGADATDSDADLITGKTTNYTLAAGEQNLTVDAGIVPPVTSLSLDKLVDKSKAKLGEVLTYTLVLTNTGTTNAINVVVRDSSSTGLRYVTGSATAPAGTTFTQGIPISTWKVAALSAGQRVSMTFQAIADSSGILYNKATIPGDTATVCTSVPVIVCTGDNYIFQLTAAPGYSSYKWYKNNVEIIGQTTNILMVTAPGTYSLATDNVSGKCPDFSCCPFIIEEDTLPSFKALAMPATCVSNQPQGNGTIVLSAFNAAYTYQYSLGSTFNEVASLSGSPKIIPAGGVIVSNLPNPTVAQAYTIRVYNASGCYTETTVMLLPTTCGCPENVCVPLVIKQTKRVKRIGDLH